MSAADKNGSDIVVAGTSVPPGKRVKLEIPLAEVPATRLVMPMPVEVVRGVEPGPIVWVNAAIHGDELNGVEVIRQLLKRLSPKTLRGSVLAVPIVNMFGFVLQSRYLPDRRDLNRSFPGSPRGSLAGRLAHVFMKEIVAPCSHGVDLHTGSDGRHNLPQIRADLQEDETRRCALAFGAPVSIDAHTRDGSLRDAASGAGKHVLLYEAGEPQRFNRAAVRVGVDGVLRVLAELGMIDEAPPATHKTAIATSTRWVRARASGLLRLEVSLGDRVEPEDRLAVISDAFGDKDHVLRAPKPGIVIGRAGNPVVRRGDAVVNLATDLEGSQGS